MELKNWHLYSATAAVILLSGAPQVVANSGGDTSRRVYEFALSLVGKTTAEAGSWVDPHVSCAAVTSKALEGADTGVPKHAAVVTGGGLVKNLMDKGWKFVPRTQSIPGDIVFHDQTPGSHGKEHIGTCSNIGCTTSINTKGGRVVNDNYPERYKEFIDRGSPYGGVLRAPN